MNSGAYWFKVKDLLEILTKITNKNSKQEFYLTDTIELLISNKKTVTIFKTKNSEFCLGANTSYQLFKLNQILRKKIIYKFIEKGVEFINLDGIIISPNVKIESGTKILPGSIFTCVNLLGRGPCFADYFSSRI